VKAIVLVACLAALGLSALRGASAAGASDCASLGAAAGFGVFSDGAFTATSGGTTIVGRICGGP
jgi:hypothetical protein